MPPRKPLKGSKTKHPAACWVSVSYCPGAPWFIDMYGPKEITRYVYATRAEAQAAKRRIDEMGCGGGCQKWHALEHATYKERQQYPKHRVYHIERKDYRRHGHVIPAVFDNIDRALSRNVRGCPWDTDRPTPKTPTLLTQPLSTIQPRRTRQSRRAGLTASVRFAIFKRDGYRCRLCGASPRDAESIRLEVDHITPHARGGTNDHANLWTLCFTCNRGKGTREL